MTNSTSITRTVDTEDNRDFGINVSGGSVGFNNDSLPNFQNLGSFHARADQDVLMTFHASGCFLSGGQVGSLYLASGIAKAWVYEQAWISSGGSKPPMNYTLSGAVAQCMSGNPIVNALGFKSVGANNVTPFSGNVRFGWVGTVTSG